MSLPFSAEYGYAEYGYSEYGTILVGVASAPVQTWTGQISIFVSGGGGGGEGSRGGDCPAVPANPKNVPFTSILEPLERKGT